ncbi:L-ribulose-5-phosphate 4-epimerase [Vibrio cincinnatiensis]|uniref:L-ribulose-5-phosphate 4-epimerase n=1 Tax=Vibrio cincinnatiensis TaxID=675 RepID=UPI001EDCFEF8|nr:L-ribulose-5-phosphate 4-epimerase [Vibrio cincinnatiensis]MCG3744206.1 L-ribulose-5-phosphate 4-epimerase [Vibrio cincinnatiensis]
MTAQVVGNSTHTQAQRLRQLRHEVWQANLDLQRHNLVTFTWGNVSAIDRESGLVVIKPSGVAYEDLSADNMVVVDLAGQVVEGDLNPSSDTVTHLVMYHTYPEIGGVVHTHSPHATSWAQAGKAIPALGTTHADYFYGSIPCTRALTNTEIASDYEHNTGLVLVETIAECDPMAIPGIIVKEHGPFSWGKDAHQAVHNAVVMEVVAAMALQTLQINPAVQYINQALLDKHYLRKHGANAYYGQSAANKKSLRESDESIQ